MADQNCEDCETPTDSETATQTQSPSQSSQDVSNANEDATKANEKTANAEDAARTASDDVALPRIVITFCTQCRWMLRAAYFAQELLSTFSGTTLGEVALKPATGGVFTVEMVYRRASAGEDAAAGKDPSGSSQQVTRTMLWDRKAEGGFPGTWAFVNYIFLGLLVPGWVWRLPSSDGSTGEVSGRGSTRVATYVAETMPRPVWQPQPDE